VSKTAILTTIVLLSSICVWAQGSPRIEVFGGYALARIDDRNGPTQKTINQNGWTTAVTVNLLRYIGATADFGGYYGTHNTPPFTPLTCQPCITVPGVPVSTRIHSFMFGPHISFPQHPITPFGHVLFGTARIRSEFTGAQPPLALDNSAFAYALGGGLDVSFYRILAWRIQVDYMKNNWFFQSQNNTRVVTGLVVKIGER
jgi:hypothetical protein